MNLLWLVMHINTKKILQNIGNRLDFASKITEALICSNNELPKISHQNFSLKNLIGNGIVANNVQFSLETNHYNNYRRIWDCVLS